MKKIVIKSGIINLLKISLIIGVVLYGYWTELLAKPTDTPVAEMLKYNVLGAMTSDEVNVVMALDNLLFMVIFHLLFGCYISRNFERGPSYYFSRIIKKEEWFLKKSAELFIWVMVYVSLYLGSHLWSVTQITTAKITKEVYAVLGIQWMICVWVTYCFVLLINLMGIIWNKVISYVFVYGIILFFVFLPSVTLDFGLQLVNPFAYMQIFEKGDSWLYIKVGYIVLLSVLVLIAGAIFMKKYDISLKEVD